MKLLVVGAGAIGRGDAHDLRARRCVKREPARADRVEVCAACDERDVVMVREPCPEHAANGTGTDDEQLHTRIARPRPTRNALASPIVCWPK